MVWIAFMRRSQVRKPSGTWKGVWRAAASNRELALRCIATNFSRVMCEFPFQTLVLTKSSHSLISCRHLASPRYCPWRASQAELPSFFPRVRFNGWIKDRSSKCFFNSIKDCRVVSGKSRMVMCATLHQFLLDGAMLSRVGAIGKEGRCSSRW